MCCILIAGQLVESFESYVRRIFLGALALVVIPAGLLILAGCPAWSRGVALGGAASLINLLFMARDVRLKADLLKHQRVTASARYYGLRMGTVAAALLYASVDEGISLWAVIPSLFCVQAVIILDGLTGWLEGTDTPSRYND